MTMRRWLAGACLLAIASVSAPASAQQSVRAKGDAVSIYQAADVKSAVLATVPVGATLDLVAEAGEWYRVRQRSTGTEGFVRKAAVELLKGAAVAQPGVIAPAGAGSALAGQKPGAPASAGGQKPGAAAPAGTKPAGAKPGATSRGSWTDRGYLAVSGAYQAAKSGFTDRFSFAQYAEQAEVTTTHSLEAGSGFDVGGGIRLWRNLAVGVHVTAFSRADHPTIEATVPHPLYLREPREFTGEVASAVRDELGVHLQAAFVVPVGRKMLVTLAAGPSWIRMRQTVVDEVRWNDAYPYTTADYTSAVTRNVEESKVGYNAGVDVAYYFTRYLGVGALVRYAGVSVSVPFKGGTQSLRSGGPQAAVGLRVRFARSVPKPKPAPQPPPKFPVKK